MPSQKVFRLRSPGSGEHPELTEENIPSPDKSEVLIKIKALALNFRDIAIIAGQYPLPVKDNLIPCSDAAGEVVEVGSSAGDIKKGDQVIVSWDVSNLYGTQQDHDHAHGGSIDGFLREYVAVPASAVVKIPSTSKLSPEERASLVCAGTTVWNALYGNVPLKPGQTVLFQGTGGVSIMGLIIAKAAGARTIITSSSDEKLDLMKKKYGADETVNYKKQPDWADAVNKLTGGVGVDYILENGGSGTIQQSIACIKRGGMIAQIGFLATGKHAVMPDVAQLVMSKACILRGINIGSKQLLEELVQFTAGRELPSFVDKTFPFGSEGVAAAYDYLKSGSQVGKVCISME